MKVDVQKFFDLLRESWLLPIIFAGVVVLFVIMSSTYLYHWKTYSMNPRVERFVKIIYFSMSGILIIIALASLMLL